MIFAAYLRDHDMHIDFLRLLFLVGVICPLMQEHSLRLKKLISQVPEAAMFKIRRPVYKRFINLNQIACYVPTKKRDRTCQQSVFSPIAACIRIWVLWNDARETTVPNVCLQALTLSLPSSFPLLAIFSPHPTLSCMDRVLRLRNRQGSKAHVFRHDRRGFKRFINRT